MANIIITGANQGIGYYFTEQALKDGNKVAVLDVETDKLEALAQAFPKQLLYYNTDVCDEIQINSAVKEIIAAFHFIDIAIHNACLCTFDVVCFALMRLRMPIMIFGIMTIVFCALYSVVASILVYRLAPKTFRLRT